MKLWATRESRTELLMACLRVVMGVIFLSVWSYNLTKGYYSPSGWAHFVQHYADTTKVSAYAHLLDSVMIPHANLFARGQFAIEFVVFGLFLVLGAVHAGLGSAGVAVPAEPAGGDVGDQGLARHLHHHGRAAAGREPLAGRPDTRGRLAPGAQATAPATAGLLRAGRRAGPESEAAPAAADTRRCRAPRTLSRATCRRSWRRRRAAGSGCRGRRCARRRAAPSPPSRSGRRRRAPPAAAPRAGLCGRRGRGRRR